MSSKEVIKVAIAKLDIESKNYYQSANEALYTSVCYAVVSFAIFTASSIVIPSQLIPLAELKSLIGIGGGGTASGITLAWGFRQRLERRDKARQIEAQKKSLEMLSEISSLDSEADRIRIVTATLELTLRTISAPYDFSREKIEGTE
ncbi:hypothetical protein [Pantanalinema sp. GBBB05]|uniref:hypothetical protein n=1 Tax=Pantanalinema sp. GBBB05 TaxID=2604139 RepID=UPI001DA1FACE|nr:hypothetical protein [Pantanalinema sp. GBBB05]